MILFKVKYLEKASFPVGILWAQILFPFPAEEGARSVLHLAGDLKLSCVLMALQMSSVLHSMPKTGKLNGEKSRNASFLSHSSCRKFRFSICTQWFLYFWAGIWSGTSFFQWAGDTFPKINGSSDIGIFIYKFSGNLPKLPSETCSHLWGGTGCSQAKGNRVGEMWWGGRNSWLWE